MECSILRNWLVRIFHLLLLRFEASEDIRFRRGCWFLVLIFSAAVGGFLASSTSSQVLNFSMGF